ncbi:hypothetical protein V6N11_009999 [Hibiscus sabdariffa]|uniref:Uncharacterized protein n=2 Tax=Hibiscus sabdariffa TaxID=183260 RepID=A0ABR2PDE0_9ROSI
MPGNPSDAAPALFGGSGGRPPDSRPPSAGSMFTEHEGDSPSHDQSDGLENSIETMEVQQTVIGSAHEEDVEKLVSKQGAIGKETYATMVSKGTGSVGISSSGGFGKDDVVVLADDFVIDRSWNPPVSKPMEVNSPQVDKGSELFGPWMVAESRRRRNTSLNRNGQKKDNTGSGAEGSRFAALSNMGTEDTLSPVVGMLENNTMDRVQPVDADPVMVSSEKVRSQEVQKSAAYMKSNPDKKKKVGSKPVEASCVVSLVKDKEPEVAVTESAQGAGLHRAVSIVERYDGSKPLSGGKMVKARSQGNKGATDGTRRGFSLRKPAELRSGATQNLAAWVQGMSQQLPEVEQQCGAPIPSVGVAVDPPPVGERKEQHITSQAVEHTDCMDNISDVGDGIDNRPQ